MASFSHLQSQIQSQGVAVPPEPVRSRSSRIHSRYLSSIFSLLASWSFLYLFRPLDQPIVLFERTFVILPTSVGSLLISSLMVGLAIVCAHGAFRVPEDLFLDNQEPNSSGFLSFLGSAAAAVARV
ncbi:PRA1 family protein B4-like [Glycine max]|uniref:PRA1 family protein B4-like n=1 Tax=Glycine max TaxID=3847 RepID=UPI0003DEB67E|nr:PRA1 family protein B4-like [Glycine max]|eukprot:XP_006603265.1 PRA1 family protein B4-like [Glycine max]